MPVKGCQAKILVDEFDFSSQTNGVALDAPMGVIEYSVLQNCAVLKIPTFATPVITQNGYYTGPNAGQIEKELSDRLAAENDVTVALLFGTDATNPVAYVLPTSFNAQLTIAAPVADLITLNGKWPSGEAPIYRGHQVFYGAVTGTGAPTPPAYIDIGGAGSAGGKAWLQVQAISGTAAGADVTIESDTVTNFASAATEGTFTFSAPGMYEIDLAGTVNRYIRVNVTDLGGASGFTILAIVAVAGRTYRVA